MPWLQFSWWQQHWDLRGGEWKEMRASANSNNKYCIVENKVMLSESKHCQGGVEVSGDKKYKTIF
jgi:hypothetical protein